MHATKIAYATLHRLKRNKQKAKYDNAKAISVETGGAVSIAELCELPASARLALPARAEVRRAGKKKSSGPSADKKVRKPTSYVPPKLAAARA